VSKDKQECCHDASRQRTVSGGVDGLGQGRDIDSEALLHVVQDCGVLSRRDERDGKTLGSEATSTTNSVEVGVGTLAHVVVDNDVDTLDINTAAKDVGRHHDAGLKVLELAVALDTEE